MNTGNPTKILKKGVNQATCTTGLNKVDSSSMPMSQSAMISNKYTTPAVASGLAVTSNHNQFQTTPATQLANQNSSLTLAGGSGMSGHVLSQAHDPTMTSSQGQGQSQETELQQNPPSQSCLANTKEKTPMCLINELARFNKVSHQYTLVDEQGPAHKKIFFMKLQLGDQEEYSASGPSIKKAQHAAAAVALDLTVYKHPPPKPAKSMTEYQQRFLDGQENGFLLNNITPTVELNSLAMKRGEPTIYKNLENKNPHPFTYQPYDYPRGMYNQRYPYMRVPRTYYVSLKVGQREFIGEGSSRQTARHHAAAKALRILKTLPVPEVTEVKVDMVHIVKEEPQEVEAKDDDSKSEISVVHELALRHSLPVSFDVVRESGPPHMKNFVTNCVVGPYQTESEGNSKKLSKKRAAELMLEELKKLPLLPPATARPKPKSPVNKKKNRNLIKEMQKTDPSYGVGVNPISRLIQIQQAQKKREPLYTLLAERGLPRRREFVMQVMVDDHTCTGVGPNKKLAKRHAAEAMLQLLGYNKPSPQPSKSAIKLGTESHSGEKKVTFVENTEQEVSGPTVNGQGGRQMVPGIIVLPEGNRAGLSNYSHLKSRASQYHAIVGKTVPAYPGVRPEIQLRELTSKNNIEIKFDEFAGKNNTNEYLCRLVVNLNPPQHLHGSGTSPETARDAVSLTALKALTDLGIFKEDRVSPAGDAPAAMANGIDLMANSKMVTKKD